MTIPPVPPVPSEVLDTKISTLEVKAKITKTLLDKNRQTASTVLLELRYQLSRQTTSIKVK